VRTGIRQRQKPSVNRNVTATETQVMGIPFLWDMTLLPNVGTDNPLTRLHVPQISPQVHHCESHNTETQITVTHARIMS
jgi:hypothetical protein